MKSQARKAIYGFGKQNLDFHTNTVKIFSTIFHLFINTLEKWNYSFSDFGIPIHLGVLFIYSL